jgi:hypothetical protein
MSPVDVLTDVVIDRPRHEVAAFVSELGNTTRWYKNISSAEWKSDPPLRVGSKLAFAARFLGRELRYTYEVTDLVPDERLVMRTEQGPFPMETTYTWEDAPAGGTRMTLRNRGEPSGFGKVAGPAMASAMRRANRKDLDRLKQLLEAPG